MWSARRGNRLLTCQVCGVQWRARKSLTCPKGCVPAKAKKSNAYAAVVPKGRKPHVKRLS